MSRRITWEEMKEFLAVELKKTKHIMTWSTIGSTDSNRDIDTIISKKPSSKFSDFYREVHAIFDKLNDYIYKKTGGRVIRIPATSYLELLKLAEYSKNDVVFHTMIEFSFPQMNKEWLWCLFPDVNLKQILEKSNYLLGTYQDFFSKEFQKESYYDSLFTYLALGDRIHSGYEKSLLLETMNESFDFIMHKRLKIKPFTAKNEKEAREFFYKICDTIDKLNSKKPIK